MLKDKKIIVGVSSGVAIYKTLDLVSRLKKEGADVFVIMTPNATKLINPLLFKTISKNKVYVDLFEKDAQVDVSHIQITKDADVFLIAPATANTIAKINSGIADNFLTTSALAYKKNIIFCESMNENMLTNPITIKNIKSLEQRGHIFTGTDYGNLACNIYGLGRMREPKWIIEFLKDYFTKKDLRDKNILVSAGATISKIDPVRYITNHSSGKMGIEIAKNAKKRGANVTLVVGNVEDFYLEELSDIKIIKAITTKEMSKYIQDEFLKNDVIIMASAPCDFEADYVDKKIKKNASNDVLNIKLKKSCDILKSLKKCERKIIGSLTQQL